MVSLATAIAGSAVMRWRRSRRMVFASAWYSTNFAQAPAAFSMEIHRFNSAGLEIRLWTSLDC